ncbi:MAG: NADH-quinone oxidoreductase subunit NuoH [Helicobacteraceae bacterium]
MNDFWFFVTETVLKAMVILIVLSVLAGFTTYIERKVLAYFQRRLGPVYVGPYGLFQLVADGIKLFTKEDVVPSYTIRPIFYLAPLITAACAFIAMAPIPFLPPFEAFGRQINFVVSDINVGVLFVMAITAAGLYGPLLAGMASRNKWALLSGARVALLFISYEVVSGLAVLAPIMLVGSLSITAMVAHQTGGILDWLIFKQPLAFLLFLIAGTAETNRTPLETMENDPELVAGYATEYSGMRWGLFFIGEYANLYTFSFLAALIFLGGWNDFYFIPGGLAVILKVAFMVFFFLWARSTWPHIRPDQIMWMMWKVLMPLAVVNIFVTGLVVLL